MSHYIAVIHKEADSAFGASFPDVPGVTAAGDTLDDVVASATEALSFAAEDWPQLTGREFPSARTIDELRSDDAFGAVARDAILVAVPLRLAVSVRP